MSADVIRPMSPTAVAAARIKAFLSDRLLIEFGDDIRDDSDLFELGLIDSQTYVELIRFIEAEFKLQLSDEQILENEWVSVDGIVAWIEGLSGDAHPVGVEVSHTQRAPESTPDRWV